MSKYFDMLSIVLLALFLFNGAFYYLMPGQLYNPSGWFVWLKYFIFIGLVLIAIVRAGQNKNTLILFSILSFIFCIGILFNIANKNFVLSLQYFIPLFSILIYGYLRNVVSRQLLLSGIVLLLSVSTVASICDIFLGGMNDRFSYSGTRAASIFVNPNNAAIVISIVGLTGIYYAKKISVKISFIFLSLVNLLLCGSKTGLVVFVFGGVILEYQCFLPILMLLAALILYNLQDVFLFWQALNLRAMDGGSFGQRLVDWAEFFRYLDNLGLRGIFFGFYIPKFGIDNSYFDMWYQMGIIPPFATLCLQGLVIFKAYRVSILLFVINIVFLLSMITTNVLRLWPLGFIFWFCVAAVFYRERSSKTFLSDKKCG